MDWLSGSVSGRIRPSYSYPVFDQIQDSKTGYRIFINTFFSFLKNWDASIVCVTLSNTGQEATLWFTQLKYPVFGTHRISGILSLKWPDIRKNCYLFHPYIKLKSNFLNSKNNPLRPSLESIPNVWPVGVDLLLFEYRHQWVNLSYLSIFVAYWILMYLAL